jgi:hypothetical protein
MLCSVKGSVQDLSKIFMPNVEGKFHATKLRVSEPNKETQPFPAKLLPKEKLRSKLTRL